MLNVIHMIHGPLHPLKSIRLLHTARLALLLCASVTVWGFTTAAHAQHPLRPASVEVGVGLHRGHGGGTRTARAGPAASALVAWQVRDRGSNMLVAAASLTVQGPDPFNQDCSIPVGGGDCIPDYPSFYTAALLGGWHFGRNGPGQGVRALLGPAVVQSAERIEARSRVATGAGLQGRADATTPVFARAALLLWAQGTFVPRLQRETYFMTSIGIGVRLH